MEFNTIEVDLEPDNDPESIGIEYRAIVMHHCDSGVTNSGIVARASSPEAAFCVGMKLWKAQKTKHNRQSTPCPACGGELEIVTTFCPSCYEVWDLSE
jgi:DnaJ-class molecular chaperone